MEINKLQARIGEYNYKEFPDNADTDMFEGMVEEAGELAEVGAVRGAWKILLKIIGRLAHHRLKGRQGIRGDKMRHIIKEKDAIGDLLNFLAHYCNLRGYSLDEIATATLPHIENREEGKKQSN